MGNEDKSKEEYKININMWKHYDNLRQEKNKTFLTVNTILVAALGFILRDTDSIINSFSIMPALVALLGSIICVLWFQKVKMLPRRGNPFIEIWLPGRIRAGAGLKAICFATGGKSDLTGRNIVHTFFAILMAHPRG